MQRIAAEALAVSQQTATSRHRAMRRLHHGKMRRLQKCYTNKIVTAFMRNTFAFAPCPDTCPPKITVADVPAVPTLTQTTE